MALPSLRALGANLKDKWDNFSLTGKENVKAQIFAAVATPVFIGGALALATGIGFLPYLAFCVLFPLPGFALTAFTTDLAKDWFKSRKPETWTNDAGQVVSGTYAQKQDLDCAQGNISFVVQNRAELTEKDRLSIKSIMDRFNPVAKKVTVVQDIPGNDGTFRFAQTTETATETTTVVKTKTVQLL